MAVESDLVSAYDIGPGCIAIRSRWGGVPKTPPSELEGEVAPVGWVVLVRARARREEFSPRVGDRPRSREHGGAPGVGRGGGNGARGRRGGGGRAAASGRDGQRGAGWCPLLELLDLTDEVLGLRILVQAGIHGRERRTQPGEVRRRSAGETRA